MTIVINGTRQEGCMRKAWWDGVKQDMKSFGLAWEMHTAQVRNKQSMKSKGATFQLIFIQKMTVKTVFM